ncbi:hypothetical protein B0J17DRAFT_722978 [Rhizoctonia solani]|nr:hypothetical protein B0J17DRAFT_722978 [Rhizoctonia solani]
MTNNPINDNLGMQINITSPPGPFKRTGSSPELMETLEQPLTKRFQKQTGTKSQLMTPALPATLESVATLLPPYVNNPSACVHTISCVHNVLDHFADLLIWLDDVMWGDLASNLLLAIFSPIELLATSVDSNKRVSLALRTICNSCSDAIRSIDAILPSQVLAPEGPSPAKPCSNFTNAIELLTLVVNILASYVQAAKSEALPSPPGQVKTSLTNAPSDNRCSPKSYAGAVHPNPALGSKPSDKDKICAYIQYNPQRLFEKHLPVLVLPEVNAAVAQWLVQELSNPCLHVTGNMTQEKAHEFNSMLGYPNNILMFFNGWLKQLKNCVKLSQHVFHGEASSAPVEHLEDECNWLFAIIAFFAPWNIYNVDKMS